MKKILTILSSPGGAASFSNRLSQAINEKLLSKYLGSTIFTRNLTHIDFPHVDSAQIAAYYTPRDQWTDNNRDAIQHSDTLVTELMDADIIVIGVPMHNFGIPSTLKAWIDHIARAGLTFRFTATGVEGLAKGKQVYLAIATGNIYSTEEWKPYDFTEPYLRAILGFLGMTDVCAYRAEGTAIPGIQDTALQKAIDSIEI